MRIPLLRHLRLPHLVSLTISHGYGLSTSDVIQVLQNNKALSSVDFLDTKLDASSAIIMVKKRKHFQPAMHIGLSVERIKGTPSFLRGMLDLELAFLHLNTVVIQIRSDSRNDQAQLLYLYRSLAEGGRVNISNLVFEFPPPCGKRAPLRLEDWLGAVMGQQGLEDGMKGAMMGLEHVRMVHLHYLSTPKHPYLLPAAPKEAPASNHQSPLPSLLSSWISMFPALLEVTFAHIFPPDSIPIVDDFFARLSPAVAVRIDGCLNVLAS